jgi:hypothetical protein
MVDRDNRDLIRIDPIEDPIGKTPHHHSPYPLENDRGRLRHTADAVKRLLHTQEELIAQPLPLIFVPSLGLGKILFYVGSDNER